MTESVLRLIRWTTGLYALFLVAMVYTANAGIEHPGSVIVRNLPWGDKMGHIVLFGALTFVVNLALRCRMIRLGRLALPLGTVAVAVVVLVEELSQGFVANRTLDRADLAADAVGIAVATVAALAVWRFVARPRVRRGSATEQARSTTVGDVHPIDPAGPEIVDSASRDIAHAAPVADFSETVDSVDGLSNPADVSSNTADVMFDETAEPEIATVPAPDDEMAPQPEPELVPEPEIVPELEVVVEPEVESQVSIGERVERHDEPETAESVATESDVAEAEDEPEVFFRGAEVEIDEAPMNSEPVEAEPEPEPEPELEVAVEREIEVVPDPVQPAHRSLGTITGARTVVEARTHLETQTEVETETALTAESVEPESVEPESVKRQVEQEVEQEEVVELEPTDVELAPDLTLVESGDDDAQIESGDDDVQIESAEEVALPTMVDLDEISIDLDRIDAALVALDQPR